MPQKMYGLETYVKSVEATVTSEGSDAAPRYVGVWGMGGVGKTLLLQRLYGSPKVRGHFQGAKFIWRTVGETPDIKSQYHSLSEELGLKPELNLALEDYKLKLYNQFIQKRVFLVLDDVWEDKAFDSLDLAKGKGSVTLLSTRLQSILKRASPYIRQENMTPLSWEDSWSLFCVHAFRPPFNVPCELKEVAQSMAKECEGLPLALKVIGRAMFGKTSPELEWDPLEKKLSESRMQERSVEEELYERLKLGYDLLSEDDWRLKDCFLYFAAFPEDHFFQFEDVVYHLIGEGLVPAHDGDEPTADALSLLNKLCERSFIETNREVGAHESRSLEFKLHEDVRDLLPFTVHDVMRDLAFYILEKDCGTPPAKQLYFYRADQNLEEFPEECTSIPEALRLSLHSNELETLPESFYAPKLVSLILATNDLILLRASFFRSCLKLRVLDLCEGYFQDLPEEVFDLKDLVYLGLSRCENLQILPDAVGKLHLLKVLDLSFCSSLPYLPSGIVALTSLQVLDVYSCWNLKWAECTPSGIISGESWDPTIKATLEDICGLVHLTNLQISARTDPGLELPQNISALTNLKILRLELKGVKSLPAKMAYWCIQLQELDLSGCKELKYLPKSFTCRGAFPALVKLCLNYSRLVEFPEVDEGALPKLRTLDLNHCKFLENLPLSLEVLTNLRVLNLFYCRSTLKNSCRTNCEKSSIWRSFDIRYGRPWDEF